MGIFKKHINQEVSIAPLVVFRIIFGVMMFGSIVRFWANGWIEAQFLQPTFFFTYFGFEWVKPFDESGMYILFGTMAISALFIMFGFLYRLSSVVFFLLFTYVELIDVTNYLNHYYFISLVACLMIFLPAHRSFSIDVWLRPSLLLDKVPAWTINSIKIQLGIVYFFAGVAKLHPDWLIEAQPLRLWLSARTHFPVIGFLFKYVWVAYFFAWFGAIYDLTIPFLLLYKKTRPLAYVAVLAFHLMTGWLFPIGMFPYIMILSTLIFFPVKLHLSIISFLKYFTPRIPYGNTRRKAYDTSPIGVTVIKYLFFAHFIIQLLLPFRYALYPESLFWTEQGFRFSWRVMLMEKTGAITFFVQNKKTNHLIEINNADYLTPLQEKMMATQPDMILQYAHFLQKEYEKLGLEEPAVFAQSYVTLNGRPSKEFIDPTVDLTKIEDSFQHKDWVLPF